jgi:hypothetical protein
MQLSDARRSGRIKVVDGWAEFPGMLPFGWFEAWSVLNDGLTRADMFVSNL